MSYVDLHQVWSATGGWIRFLLEMYHAQTRGGACSGGSNCRYPRWHLHYRVFRGVWSTWEELFRQASEFADDIGPEKVVSISHSEDKDDGVVAVWYWTESRPTD